MRIVNWIWVVLLSVCILTACNINEYEKGDTELSYLQTEFVEAYTNSAGKVYKVRTDNNNIIKIQPEQHLAGADKADTLYRAMFHYKAKEDEKAPIRLFQVPVLRIEEYKTPDDETTDPVIFRSAWIAQNKKYLNVEIALKTADVSDESMRHKLRVVIDKITTTEKRNIYYLKLIHRRNGIPEHYSSKLYFSIPIHNIASGDKVVLSIATYEKVVSNSFDC